MNDHPGLPRHAKPHGLRARFTALLGDSLTTNSGAMMLNNIINSGFGYLFWIVAARSYEASVVGAASAVISAATIASVFSDLGMRTLVMQELPRLRESRAWSQMVTIAVTCLLLTSALAGTAAWLVLRLLSDETRELVTGPTLAIVLTATIGLTIGNLLDGISTAEKRAHQLLTRSAVLSAAKLLSLLVLAHTFGFGGASIVAALALGLLVADLYGLLRQLRRLQPEFTPHATGWRTALKPLAGDMTHHYLLNLGGWLPPFVLPLQVVALASTAENAYFTFTWMLGSAFFMVSPSIAASLFVHGRWDLPGLNASTKKAFRLIMLLLTPIGLVFIGAGYWILSLFGADYASHGYVVLVILVVSAVPDAITNIRIARLRALGRVQIGAVLNLFMAVIAISFAFPLISTLGIAGAALAWLLAQTAGSVALAVVDHRVTPAGDDASVRGVPPTSTSATIPTARSGNS